jgi:hypothetical protein
LSRNIYLLYFVNYILVQEGWGGGKRDRGKGNGERGTGNREQGIGRETINTNDK